MEYREGQKPKSWQTINSFYIKIILYSSQSKEFLPKNPLKKYLQKNPTKKFPQKNQKNSEQFLKKFIRFWKYPFPYIVLGGRKPFRACLLIDQYFYKSGFYWSISLLRSWDSNKVKIQYFYHIVSWSKLIQLESIKLMILGI